jgi:RHS repeat-associated protein
LAVGESGGGGAGAREAPDVHRFFRMWLSKVARPPTLHSRWGRLTQVWFSTGAPGSTDPPNRAVYRYNGLTMRCLVERDADTTDATHALSERRAIYYGAGWQVLEEHVDTGMEGTYDSLTQNVWGLRYIDELVLRRTNANWNGGTDSDFTDSTDTEWEQYLHDHQFSVVAGVNRVGTLTFRVAYDAYGEARHSWARDIDGDGDVDSDDYNIANAARTKEIDQTGYNADADWNRDGEVTSTDVAAFGSTHHAGAIPAGLVAPRTSELTVGFCGYRFNPEIGAYTVRFRHYDPTPGVARWLERDPAGYVDGPSLYGYLGRSPVDGVDPSGLARYRNYFDDAIRDYQNDMRQSAHSVWSFLTDLEVLALDVAEFAVEETATNLVGGLAVKLLVKGIRGLYRGGELFAITLENGVGGVVGKRRPGSGRTVSLTNQILNNPLCFVPGTMVETCDGPRPIETLTPGDTIVTSRTADEASSDADATKGAESEGTSATVIQVSRRLHVGPIVSISLADERGETELIHCTPEHYLWITGSLRGDEFRRGDALVPFRSPEADGVWIRAGDLRRGDELGTLDGTTTVLSVTIEPYAGLVYNLEVSDLPWFAVGAAQAIAHNGCPTPEDVLNAVEENLKWDRKTEEVFDRFNDTTKWRRVRNKSGFPRNAEEEGDMKYIEIWRQDGVKGTFEIHYIRKLNDKIVDIKCTPPS